MHNSHYLYVDMPLSSQVLQGSQHSVRLNPVFWDTTFTGCQNNKLIHLQLIREILGNCSVDKFTGPLKNWKRVLSSMIPIHTLSEAVLK